MNSKHEHEYELVEVEEHIDCITERDPMTLEAYRIIGSTYVNIQLKCINCGKDRKSVV